MNITDTESKPYPQQEDPLDIIVHHVTNLPIREQEKYIEILFQHIDQKSKRNICEILLKHAYPRHYYSTRKIEMWIEKLFQHNDPINPKRNMTRKKATDHILFYIDKSKKMKKRKTTPMAQTRKKIRKIVDKVKNRLNNREWRKAKKAEAGESSK